MINSGPSFVIHCIYFTEYLFRIVTTKNECYIAIIIVIIIIIFYTLSSKDPEG